jgi:hypothetical protein
MPDGFSVTCDDRALLAALDRIGPAVEKYTKAAAKVTADAVQRTAQRIVARRTGATAAGIEVREDYSKKGYVVVTNDVMDEADLAARKQSTSKNIRRRANAKYYQEKHTGLWLEKGTVQGKPGSHTGAPRPFFFPASELEQSGYARRMREAVQQAIAEVGLGE